MKKTTSTVFFASLITLLGFCSVLFYSCNKDDDPKPFYLYVENPFPYDIRIKGHLKGCGYGGDGCLHYPGKIYEGATPGHSGNIQAFNDETGDAIDLAIYDADMEGGYVWVVGSGNHLVKVEDYDNGSGNGGGNSGGNNGGSNGGNNGGNDSDDGAIVFYSTGNLDECEYVEVSISKELGSDGLPKNPLVKTFKGVVKVPYDVNKDVSCGMQGAATFNVPPGKYYIFHKTVNCTNAPYYKHTLQWRTIEKGDCIKVRLTR